MADAILDFEYNGHSGECCNSVTICPDNVSLAKHAIAKTTQQIIVNERFTTIYHNTIYQR